MKIFTKALLGGVLALSSYVSHADTVFNFAELIDTKTGEISGTSPNNTLFNLSNPGELAFSEFDWVINGINLNVSASYKGSNQFYSGNYLDVYQSGDPYTAWAYLDQGRAGLGVCSKGLKTDGKGKFQCNPANDDNTTLNEWLHLGFDSVMTIDFSKSTLRDADHRVINNALANKVQLSNDDGNSWFSMSDFPSLSGDKFIVRTIGLAQQFYIDTLVATEYDLGGGNSTTDVSVQISLAGSFFLLMGGLYLVSVNPKNKA